MIKVSKLDLTPGFVNIKERHLNISDLNLEGVNVELRQYQDGKPRNINFFMKRFISGKADTSKNKPDRQPWLVRCNTLKIRNTHFVYENQLKKEEKNAIDYNDIEVIDLDILASDIVVDRDTIYVTISNIGFVEKSGFELEDFSGRAMFCPTGLEVKNLIIKTKKSSFDFDVSFKYQDLSAFQNFIELVRFDVNFRDAKLQMSEIGYFSETMYSMEDWVEFNGHFIGTVANIRGKKFAVNYGDATRFEGSVNMNGLPDITETFIHADIDNFTTSANDVRAFALPANVPNIKLPKLLTKMGKVNIQGKFTGFYNDFVSKADFNIEPGGFGKGRCSNF